MTQLRTHRTTPACRRSLRASSTSRTLPWEKTRFAGVEGKTLLVDKRHRRGHGADEFAPGARLPDHEHVQIEQTYVLEGALMCGEGECKAGRVRLAPRRQPPRGLGRAARAA